ncbi:YifB family Mg chelatase-like AAA ATPase [Halocynthiibacter styelae]|uniref:YifB family Mg chelatase-like AAA ATPase n=1 Tax=Halocynthiibacter styelae TaxID=2761955 RepID=A0A8J7IF70_9RHOB|nr:YifB family Mg chelatase-like AAA ATPase [Paenihalocynthiibacter styelae]MBI1494622.1 YifB family Mg chelatase-like AAA ATPase [Paenihalocynthiibacter styelae]
MVARAFTVAFEGIEARLVEVQCATAPGLPGFAIVGLPGKAVAEARERVRAALTALQIALPPKKITINLSPADMPKAGSHYDLPIALALLAAMGVLPEDKVENTIALGELSLDGKLIDVPGTLPAALTASETGRSLICPLASGAGAAWINADAVFAPANLHAAIRHLTGQSPLDAARPGMVQDAEISKDFRDIKGQYRGKRAMEIAAAGHHHVFLLGPPGSGKSMLAARLPGILPPLRPEEALETSLISSLTGQAGEGISRQRPFREPHHTASVAALSGGGRDAKPGEVSLAHNGVLFMDEFPEFPSMVLDTLRQPLETGAITVARVNAHVRYPCRFMLVAAANPCKCGHLMDPGRACNQAPVCGEKYMGRVSGPLMDRFDLRVEIPPVAWQDLSSVQDGEGSADIAARVAKARDIQTARYADHPGISSNAMAEGRLLEEYASPDQAGRDLLNRFSDKFGLSARGYHRVLRVARTIADLEGSPDIFEYHIAEAVSYRLIAPREKVVS